MSIQKLYVLTLVLCRTLPAFPSCDTLNFQRHGSLDDLLFNDNFVSESVVEERILCGERCHRHPFCNMLLYNPTSRRCRLYKSFVNTGGTEDMGWQYYAAECNHVRLENAVSLSVVNQTLNVTCRSGFTYLLSPPLHCPLGTGVLDIGKCAQTLWTDQANPFFADLPSPLSTGAEIRVRGSGDGGSNTDIHVRGAVDGNTVFLLSIRWSHSDAIFNTESSGSWGTELGPSGFIFFPNVVFDVLVLITTTQFQIFIDGNNFYEAPIRISVQEAAKVYITFSRLESVSLKYP
ncbi:uncharacterized protein [Haliotis asinina]|uniref:uncharacterized protein n=1 Tax=Haliotis asinina TaxID=109174 RepID=UPI003531DF66